MDAFLITISLWWPKSERENLLGYRLVRPGPGEHCRHRPLWGPQTPRWASLRMRHSIGYVILRINSRMTMLLPPRIEPERKQCSPWEEKNIPSNQKKSLNRNSCRWVGGFFGSTDPAPFHRMTPPPRPVPCPPPLFNRDPGPAVARDEKWAVPSHPPALEKNVQMVGNPFIQPSMYLTVGSELCGPKTLPTA